MAPAASPTKLTFGPGPLGFELAPVWEAGGRAVGCRVAGYKRLPDGSVGQAELMGSARAGDILADVDGVAVNRMSFDKIIALLRHDTARPERHLTFQPGRPAPPRLPPPPTPGSPKARDQGASSASAEDNVDVRTPHVRTTDNSAPITSAGGSTQPATPSPGPQPKPVGGRPGFSEATAGPAGDAGAALQTRKRWLEWASLLALGHGGARVGEEAQATTGTASEVEGIGAIFGAGSDDGGGQERWIGPQQIAFQKIPSEGIDETYDGEGLGAPSFADYRANSDATTVRTFAAAHDVVGSGCRVAGDGRHPPFGVAQLFLKGGPQSVDGRDGDPNSADNQAFKDSASDEAGRGGGRAGREQEVESVPKSAECLLSVNEVTDAGEEHDSPADSFVSFETPGTAVGGGHSACPQKIPQNVVPGWHRPPGGSSAAVASEQAPYLRHAPGAAPSNATAAVTLPAVASPEQVIGVATDAAAVLDGSKPELGSEGRGDTCGGDGEQHLRGGSPETAARSLDTVSLFSEPPTNSKQRSFVLASLWERGRGGAGAGNQSDGVEAASGAAESEDGEAEGARRLARSLAVKLKERGRRCEELEDLFSLRDHQVSMLQRQSNSLAMRAAALADELSDKSALVEALQQDRERLERELAQSRSQSQSFRSNMAAAVVLDGGASGGEGGPSAPRREGKGAGGAAAAGAIAVDGAEAAAVETAEKNAEAAFAALEARCCALTEMVDSFVAEKVRWEEERASNAAEALRLRALVRGLEEAVVDRGVGGDGGGGGAGGGGDALVGELRKLLRERTRELEGKSVAMERLAAYTRELEEERRRLSVSLSAREEDIVATDKQMQALSARLKGEARASGEAAARAEAVAEELKQALAEMTAAATVVGVGVAGAGYGCEDRENDGGGDLPEGKSRVEVAERRPPSTWDSRVEWAEERARLHHNLMSLGEALRDREAQAEAEEAALSSMIEAAQDECNRSAKEMASLRVEVDTLRVELAEALLSAAAAAAWRFGGGDGALSRPAAAAAPSGSAVAAGEENAAPPSEGTDGAGGRGEALPEDGGAPSVRHAENNLLDGEGTGEEIQRSGPESREGSARDAVVGGQPSAAAELVIAAETAVAEPAAVGAGAQEGDVSSERREIASSSGSTAMSARDRWLRVDFEGTIDDAQLDLMEKEIVIEQLRSQLKQLRLRLAVMEEEQAADTPPLQGLLHQLRELKESVEAREEREQQCRDQVDLGLIRLERLKEENATAAATATSGVTSPPVSFAGSTAGASPPLLGQADTSRGEAQAAEQQRFRRQLEDSQWDLRTLKRRVEERETQLRDARGDGDRLKRRVRDAERDLDAAQGELAVAAAVAAAERRKSVALRTELQSLRAELKSVHERATSAETAATSAAATAAKRLAEEAKHGRLRHGAEGLDQAPAAAANVGAEDRASALSIALREVTAERDNLVAANRAAAERWTSDREAADFATAARTRELESMRCALAARDVELEAIIAATAGFGLHSESLQAGGAGGARDGGGGAALRGALAAVAEARRALCLVAELEEQSISLKAKAEEGKADASRLREALEHAKVAERKSAAAAAAAALTAAAAGQRSLDRPQSNNSRGETEGCNLAEARALGERAREAETALQKALAGAQRAWGVVSSCLLNEAGSDDCDEFSGDSMTAAAAPHPLFVTVSPFALQQQQQQQQAASLSSLLPGDSSWGTLVSGVEALATGYRQRGHALRRATLAARAKNAFAREARQRAQAAARAREVAEGRLEEALVALDQYRRYHQQQQHAADWGRPAGAWVAGVAGDDARPLLSREQAEHLRQIRSEVDRLENQNRTLRRSLEGGDGGGARFLGKTSESYRGNRGRSMQGGGGAPPTQPLLFPRASGNDSDGGGRSISRVDCWERRGEGLIGSSGRAGTPSPSPTRSWAAVSNAHGGRPWPAQSGSGEASEKNGHGEPGSPFGGAVDDARSDTESERQTRR